MVLLSEVKRSLGNLILLFASLLGAAFLAFLTQVVLGRVLDVESFGVIATALAFVSIGAAIIGFGIPSFWLLCFGKEGAKGKRWLRPSLQLVALLAPIVLISIWLYTNMYMDDRAFGAAMTWLLSLILLQVALDLYAAKLQLEGKYKELSGWQVVIHLGRLSVVSVAYYFDAASLNFIVLGYSITALLLAIPLIYRLIKNEFEVPQFTKNSTHVNLPPVGIYEVFKGAWPFAATAGLVMLYGRTQIVLLGKIVGMEAAASFSVAMAFLLVAYLVPHTIFHKFLLPKMHRWYNHDKIKFIAVFKFNTVAMIIFGLFGAIAVYLLSESLVPMVFGAKYKTSGYLLSGLSLCVLFRSVAASMESTLISEDNMRRKVYCQALVAIVSVVSASIFITQYGLIGAIVSKVITELSLLLVFTYTSTRYVFGSNMWRGWTIKFMR